MTNILDNINNLMQITEDNTIKHILTGGGLLAAAGIGTLAGSSLSDMQTDLLLQKSHLSNELAKTKSNIDSGLSGAAIGATTALGIGAIGKSLYRKPKQQPIEESAAGAAVADAATDAAGKVFSLGNIAKTLGGLTVAGGGMSAGYGLSNFMNDQLIGRHKVQSELDRYNSNIDIGLKAAGAGAAGAIGLGLLGKQLSKSNDFRARAKSDDESR